MDDERNDAAPPDWTDLAARLDRATARALRDLYTDLAPAAERAARGAVTLTGPVRAAGWDAAHVAAGRALDRLSGTPAGRAIDRAARDAAVSLASAAADRAVTEARNAAQSNAVTGAAFDATTAAMALAGQAAQHPAASALAEEIARLAGRNPFTRRATETARDVAGRAVTAPVVQAASRIVVDTIVDAVADVAVEVALDVGRDVVVQVVQETAREAARELAGSVRSRAEEYPVAAAAADLAARAAGSEPARAAGGLLAAFAGSAVARTATDLAARTATRATVIAVETVMAEVMREALRLAMKERLRDLLRDVAKDVVVDVMRTSWTAATRPQPVTATATVVHDEPGALARAATTVAGVPGDAWAAATTVTVRATVTTLPRHAPAIAVSALRNAARYRPFPRRVPRPAAPSAEPAAILTTDPIEIRPPHAS